MPNESQDKLCKQDIYLDPLRAFFGLNYSGCKISLEEFFKLPFRMAIDLIELMKHQQEYEKKHNESIKNN